MVTVLCFTMCHTGPSIPDSSCLPFEVSTWGDGILYAHRCHWKPATSQLRASADTSGHQGHDFCLWLRKIPKGFNTGLFRMVYSLVIEDMQCGTVLYPTQPPSDWVFCRYREQNALNILYLLCISSSVTLGNVIWICCGSNSIIIDNTTKVGINQQLT